MNHLTIHDTHISGLRIIERHSFEDRRGYFERLYSHKEFDSLLQDRMIKQINHTFTRKKGTVRGLHYQHPPFSEVKIVSCLKGSVWDVAVDLRKKSPTFLQYHAIRMSEDDSISFWIPEGFAHGFQTLTHDCKMLYLHTKEYMPNSEGALNATDPKVKVEWPLKISDISDKDRGHPFISKGFEGVVV